MVGDWRGGGADGNSATHTMDQVLTKCPHHPKSVPSITSFNAHHRPYCCRYQHDSHFANEENEAQKDEATCPKS